MNEHNLVTCLVLALATCCGWGKVNAAEPISYECHSGDYQNFVSLVSDGKLPHGTGVLSVGGRHHVATYDDTGTTKSWIYGADKWHEFVYIIHQDDVGGFFYCEKDSDECHHMGNLMQCYYTGGKQ